MSSLTEQPPELGEAAAEDPVGARLTLGQALTLGALHGPAELLPISSSGHVSLIPWLLGWEYDSLDSELRKAFEVALHAGTAAALLITLRSEVDEAVRGMDARIATLVTLSFVPPAIVGYALERPIERRLGTPPTVAIGLICGSLVMAWADRSPQDRSSHEAGAADALWLGVAQACALIPGVSRNGATLAAARLQAFHARGRQPALAPRRPAGDRRRDTAQGHPSGTSRAATQGTASVRRRRGGLVRVDARFDVADPPGRARPLAAAVCRLPDRPRERCSGALATAAAVRRIYDNGFVTDAYAAAGVDTHEADRGVAALVEVLRAIEPGRSSLAVPLPGHYASVIQVAPGLGIALATDSVGSKVIVAEQAQRFDTIGIDCVAMNVNDLICVGAEPLALLDYLAVEHADPELLREIAVGLRIGAEAAGVEIPGGEVCQLPEVIRGHPSPYGFDLVGSAFGTVALDRIVDGSALRRRRRADRPAGVGRSLQRADARPAGAAERWKPGARRGARGAGWRDGRRRPARADRDLRPRGARAARKRAAGPRPRPHHRRRAAEPAPARRRGRLSRSTRRCRSRPCSR